MTPPSPLRTRWSCSKRRSIIKSYERFDAEAAPTCSSDQGLHKETPGSVAGSLPFLNGVDGMQIMKLLHLAPHSFNHTFERSDVVPPRSHVYREPTHVCPNVDKQRRESAGFDPTVLSWVMVMLMIGKGLLHSPQKLVQLSTLPIAGVRNGLRRGK